MKVKDIVEELTEGPFNRRQPQCLFIATDTTGKERLFCRVDAARPQFVKDMEEKFNDFMEWDVINPSLTLKDLELYKLRARASSITSSAFPTTVKFQAVPEQMTLRDQFAIEAMKAYIQKGELFTGSNCYHKADMLMEARSK